MRIVREEVFGPVLTVERFSTEDEAIELANDTDLRPGRRGLDGRRLARAARRRPAPPRDRLDQRLQHATCRRRSGAASSSPGSAGNLARAVSTSTVRRSTSGRTPHPVRRAGSEGDLRDGDDDGPTTTPRRPREAARHADPRRPEPVEGLRTGRAQAHRHARRRPVARRAAPQDRLDDRPARRDVRRLAGRGLRRHGPVGQRQVDARALHDPAHRADRRRGPARWRGHRQGEPGHAARAPPAPVQHGLPALRPAAAPAGDRQRRVRPRDPRRAEGGP